MKLPFSVRDFLEVFKRYNEAYYPLQLLFVIAALFIFYLLYNKREKSKKYIFFILAAFWIWMGVAYHLAMFASINTAAYAFAVLFISQGLLLLYFSFTRRSEFKITKDVYGIAGASLIGYALVLYPIIGYFIGHKYPYSPTFGLPCPTTIFTFGILLFSKKRLPIYVVIIPIIWSIIGSTAAVILKMYEDTGLIISGVGFTILNFMKNTNLRSISKNENLQCTDRRA